MNVAGRPRRSSRNDSMDGRRPKPVVMPPISWGICSVRNCSVVGDLAAGLCVTHWDKGLDKHGRDKDDRPAVE